jgi:methylmalonyl-CoA mutase cobalamin-binding domain/chain
VSNQHAIAEVISALTELDEIATLRLVEQRLQAGDDPLQIVTACQVGMRQVGERYEQSQYYLSGLIMAGEIFREIIERLRPALERRDASPAAGCVLIGTVQGDIHDIGKNMVSMLLTSHGFSVIDLGVDVAPAAFAACLTEAGADIVGLSALLTSAYGSMRETVALLREAARRRGRPLPIIIGGGMIDEQVCGYVGADHWAADAMAGVRLCLQLVAQG